MTFVVRSERCFAKTKSEGYSSEKESINFGSAARDALRDPIASGDLRPTA